MMWRRASSRIVFAHSVQQNVAHSRRRFFAFASSRTAESRSSSSLSRHAFTIGACLTGIAAVAFTWQHSSSPSTLEESSSSSSFSPSNVALAEAKTPTSATTSSSSGNSSSSSSSTNSSSSSSSPTSPSCPACPSVDPHHHLLYVPPSSDSEYTIFAGSGNIALASEVAALLGTQLGRATIGKFVDGETKIQIHDSVRGKDVYIIQPTCFPSNDNLLELLLLISTMRRASANRVIAIVPYFSYARQLDKTSHSTIAAADVALMMQTMGVDQVVAVDLHRGQAQGFFDVECPCIGLETTRLAAPYLVSRNLRDPVVVTPVGDGVYRTTALRKELAKCGVEASVAFVYLSDERSNFIESDAQHHSTVSNEALHMAIVGDVKDRDVVFVDDMFDTASRVSAAAKALKQQGAKRIFAYATHGLFTGEAMETIANSHLHEVLVFNTIPLSQEKWAQQVKQLTISGLLAETIRRIHKEHSLLDEENS